MTEAVTRILAEINQLSEPERAELAYAVLCSLGPPDGKTDEELEAELTRRAEEIRSGKVVGRPAAEVFARLRARRS
jgi:putative addiction module component (TIGR02574 family)